MLLLILFCTCLCTDYARFPVTQHAAELSAARSEIGSNTQKIRDLYYSLTCQEDTTQSEADDLTHSQFVDECRSITESLQEQVCEKKSSLWA